MQLSLEKRDGSVFINEPFVRVRVSVRVRDSPLTRYEAIQVRLDSFKLVNIILPLFIRDLPGVIVATGLTLDLVGGRRGRHSSYRCVFLYEMIQIAFVPVPSILTEAQMTPAYLDRRGMRSWKRAGWRGVCGEADPALLTQRRRVRRPHSLARNWTWKDDKETPIKIINRPLCS